MNYFFKVMIYYKFQFSRIPIINIYLLSFIVRIILHEIDESETSSQYHCFLILFGF